MANFEKIDIRDMEQLTNVEFVGYADNDVVIIDDLRNFSKLQAIKVDFLLIIVIKQGRVAMRTKLLPLPMILSSASLILS